MCFFIKLKTDVFESLTLCNVHFSSPCINYINAKSPSSQSFCVKCNSFGTKIDFSISKIGNTKVELSESEINDIKNAKATPSTGYIPDKYYDGDNAVDDINQVYDFT